MSLTPSPEEIDLDSDTFEDVLVEVMLDVQERQSVLRYTARATAHLVCDRTAQPFDQSVEGDHAALVVYTDDEAEQQGGADDDVLVLAPDETLDISASVRDTLVLALPVRCIAPEAEDAELPTAFGQLLDESGEPYDPRWEALRKLRDDGS